MEAATDSTTFLGHPRGLVVLFFAEMWERFSFYGMRALLVLYLTQHFLFEDGVAATIYASYGSLVYLMPLLGGLIADRYLGFRKSVIFGAALLVCGHFLMAYEGAPADVVDGTVVRDELALAVMYLALAFIIVGVGFLKPSISNIVGELYQQNERRRDQGFTLFYMGINLGALSAMLLCGWLGQHEDYGWSYGFGLAGVGMLVGLITFVRGRRWLSGVGAPARPLVLTSRVMGVRRETIIYSAGFIVVVISWGLMQSREFVGAMLAIASIGAVVGIVGYALMGCSRIERQRLLVVVFLTIVSVIFWTFFEQAGTSLTLFTDRNVDKNVLGFDMQASQMGFLNPLFIILLAPLFFIGWELLGRRGWEPSTPMKFGLGVLQAGLGFAVLVYGAGFADAAGQVAVIWLVLAYLLHTTGELCLSPVGLSMVTRLSVPKIVGLMMGVWFLSSAGAHYLAGMIAGMAAVDAMPGGSVDAVSSLPVYTDTFRWLAYVGIALGAAVMASAPLVRRYMHESESDLMKVEARPAE
ncbi:MAG: MFS transporter [Gammaproteobacteria bacterium]|nr:MFS transporter [Gammaproteobacteria bacterium]HCP50491.1 MFS transporter [Gammaproteobacteria bacterium]|tara:strand:+ start:3035 stop:4609 length:1575 start_codon:yes stop_codon:yes gene_type:complete